MNHVRRIAAARSSHITLRLEHTLSVLIGAEVLPGYAALREKPATYIRARVSLAAFIYGLGSPGRRGTPKTAPTRSTLHRAPPTRWSCPREFRLAEFN